VRFDDENRRAHVGFGVGGSGGRVAGSQIAGSAVFSIIRCSKCTIQNSLIKTVFDHNFLQKAASAAAGLPSGGRNRYFW
jgi:hypothetical protein